MTDSRPDGHLAAPASGKGGPVLVLHPWWGLNETVRSVCDRLADSGYVAFAPDLFHGRVARTIAEAETLSGAHDPQRARADIRAAAAYLRDRTASQRLAVIGFSFGAYYALDFSVADSSVHAVVLFYGTGPGHFTHSRASYLGHFAETDVYEPRTNVDDLEAALRRAGRPVTFHRYPGTGHWFFEPDRVDAYNQAAATLAWERTLAFLRE